MFFSICLYWPWKAPLGKWSIDVIIIIFLNGKDCYIPSNEIEFFKKITVIIIINNTIM